jgi:hypothetical protein
MGNNNYVEQLPPAVEEVLERLEAGGNVNGY